MTAPAIDAKRLYCLTSESLACYVDDVGSYSASSRQRIRCWEFNPKPGVLCHRRTIRKENTTSSSFTPSWDTNYDL